MKMTKIALICAIAAAPLPASAATVLTFEGLADQASIGNYYNGGAGGNYGIAFSNALAVIESKSGGTGNFSNAPSGKTIAFFLSGTAATMNVAAGFNTGFSFYYAGAFAGSVSVYSGLNGTGSLLASLALPTSPNPYTVFLPVGVTFAGTAKSVAFGGSANYIGFDNITLGASTPGGAVPEPATWALMIAGFGAVGFAMRRRRISYTVRQMA